MRTIELRKPITEEQQQELSDVLDRASKALAIIETYDQARVDRLCQAVADSTVQGSLSGPLAELPADLRSGVTAKLVSLPASIELISLRDLAWDMGNLVHRHPLNLIALEALAAARHVGAGICVGTGNISPRLEAAARAERVRFRIIDG